MNKKFIKFILITIVILLTLSALFWWRNIHSRDVLRLEILGPSEAEAGSEVNYVVRYKNNGNSRLENARLVFEYPENSVMSDEWRQIQDDKIIIRGENKIEIMIGDIQPGEERTHEFKGLVFGREDSTVMARARIYYNPRNLTVEYYSETTNTIRITSVPFTFEIHLPNRAEPGKKFSFDVNYFSRIDYPISNLRIQVDYPEGFVFEEGKPRASFDNSEWDIGVLNSGQGGRIEISGSLQGEPSAAKIFRARIGFWKEGKFVLLKESTRGIELATPAIFITYQINERPQYSARTGEYLFYEIIFKNMGEDVLENLFLTARLNSDVVDFNSVQPGVGNFQEGSGMIIWDSASVSQLKFLPTMEEGRVQFSIKVKDNVNIVNPEVRIDVSLSDVRERIVTRVSSRVEFAQKGYFNGGPFNNYGPQPPSVGSSTSYTVHWSVRNHHNDLGDTKIRATLAEGVRLATEIIPEQEKIFFDPNSREVVWDIGYLPARGENFREVHFQVVFDPKSHQKESIVDIVSEAKFSARDSWTNSNINFTSRAINTTLPDDPSISNEMGIIR